MRVITGSARGRTLQTLSGEDVRPTVDRVKEAVFSIIQFEIEGRRVLDLFGGSGQMGIEALSRGAESCIFTDIDRNAVDVIKANLKTTGLSDKAQVIQADAISFLKNNQQSFDIVFLDPPYSAGLMQKVLPLAAARTAKGGVIVCESPLKEELPENAGGMSIYRSYKYGKTKITVYRPTEIQS
ncbi:MAG: 16S rRNA (guanine(966)-N(2))-methyltransferase RsmD [Clostridiales bacterium]|jgi:16S rRNA (guanine(966)-N(2))-methyltransferase RsmD|nr:16S rRNA (guanine(966)-N(2))-methyltransferase RsmD [Clostridiales bacterium]